jgi:hypothetical protein
MAESRPYSTFLSPSGAHDLAFAGPHLMRVIWSSQAPLEHARAPGPVTLSPVSPPLQGPACTRLITFCQTNKEIKNDNFEVSVFPTPLFTLATDYDFVFVFFSSRY